ncbi:hypothetical protein HO133_003533 [Letharia lupina]|uniref:Ecp2 effector protein domain-containing protein n=1 Tax=Letharia lupina TaxID=560253 RepID=A0A8H6F9J1_9LECA|nr:uncharacterized protein HO133_003533 [Letharia lupina]KAF6219708.1 hypothetical protein HO133_003533 [Letharia lupina]
MAPRWLFWLSYMTTFSGFHICGADLDNATNTPRSATKALNEPLNLTEVLDGVDSDIPAYCNGSSWPCTIAIVNLNTVPAAFLNGGGTRGPYPRSDVATYYDVQDALSEVWSDCVYGIERQVGWAATGKPIHLYKKS